MAKNLRHTKDLINIRKHFNYILENYTFIELKFGGKHAGIIDARWTINEAPMQLEVLQKRNILGTANTQFRWNFYEYL